MTTITISDELYKHLEQSAKQNNISLHKFVEQALNWAIHKTKSKPKYEMKSIEELPKEIRDIIGIAKGANSKDGDLNGRDERMKYLKEKYGV